MKRQSFILTIFSLFVIGTGLVGCEKEEDLRKPTLQLEFNTVISEANLKNASSNSIQFSEGHIILESIEFEAESAIDSLETEFEIESFITIDFATGESNPDVSEIQIREGTYTEIEIELELWDENHEAAIDLEGTWTDSGGNGQPIRFLFDSGQDFSLEKEGEFTVTESTTMIAEITFDPNIWFSGVSPEMISNADTDENGVIIISSDANTDIYDIVEEKIDLVSEVEITMDNL